MERFISENYIKENSPVTENVDPKDLYPHIVTAEETYLVSILGSDFYSHLIDAFNDEALTDDEETLVLNYLKPTVLWRSITLALPWIHFNLRNKGVVQNTDEAATSADFNSFKFIRQEATSRAEREETLLKTYLTKNTELYPEYEDQDDSLEPPSSANNLDSGLIFY